VNYPLGKPNNLVPLPSPRLPQGSGETDIFGDDYEYRKTVSSCSDFIHVMDLADAQCEAFTYLNEISLAGFYDVFLMWVLEMGIQF